MAASPDYTPQLRQLMHAVGLNSYQALYQSGVSRQQIRALRHGQIHSLRLATLLQLAEILNISLAELLEAFLPSFPPSATTADLGQVKAIQQEYQRLLAQVQQQQQLLRQSWQDETWQILESFFLQWPKAAYAARTHPQAPAVKLLPLLRPLEQLLAHWGIESIGEVAAEVNYDAQLHQLMGGTAAIGDQMRVKVDYVGYRQGDRLLRRAQVSPIAPSNR